MHALPGMQSLSVWQGQAHFWAGTLQRCVTQLASTVQGRASGLGVDSGALGALGALDAGAACEVASPGLVPSPCPNVCVSSGVAVPAGGGACGGGGSLCALQLTAPSANHANRRQLALEPVTVFRMAW